MTYDLYFDEKLEIWRRNYVTIEADSEEEAINKILEGNYDIDDSELLFETEAYIPPKEGATLEIYDTDSDELLYNNYNK